MEILQRKRKVPVIHICLHIYYAPFHIQSIHIGVVAVSVVEIELIFRAMYSLFLCFLQINKTLVRIPFSPIEKHI